MKKIILILIVLYSLNPILFIDIYDKIKDTFINTEMLNIFIDNNPNEVNNKVIVPLEGDIEIKNL